MMQFLRNARIYAGLDLGQVNDYSALCIVEYDEGNPHYFCRWADRLPLGTSYPLISDMVAARMRALSNWLPYLIVDATGPGLAVVDLMRSRGLQLAPVINTSGFESNLGESGIQHIPKREIVGTLSVLLQTGRLEIAKGIKDAETLRAELLNFQVRLGRSGGHEKYEARRSAVHDDLTIALGLACWKAVAMEEQQQIMGVYTYLRERERMTQRN
jgi:hypothetical protein